MSTIPAPLPPPTLYDYRTADALRVATLEELAESVDAARYDGGAGVILVDDQPCYVL